MLSANEQAYLDHIEPTINEVVRRLIPVSRLDLQRALRTMLTNVRRDTHAYDDALATIRAFTSDPVTVGEFWERYGAHSE